MAVDAAQRTLQTSAAGGPPAPSRHVSDARLIRAVKRGSADAANELVRRHWPRAHATAVAMLGSRAAAGDVAQESMLSALRNLDDFDASRPFTPWLNRITANRALDHLRQEQRRGEGTLLEEECRTETNPGSRIELVEALQALDPRSRAMVVLKHLGGFSSEEIAAQLDSNPGTVRSTISRALAKLRLEDEPPSKGASHER